MTTDSIDTSVVVIGGGQAGLSVSFYLKRLGLDPGNEFVVLDRGPDTGGAWQFRWDALRIGSAHRINDLPGLDALDLSFENADRQSPAKRVVASYYRQYEEFYGFQVVRPANVTRVENRGPNLAVVFNDGAVEQTVTTDVVINATGTWGSPFVPWYPGLNSFTGKHVHTTEYTRADDYAGKKIVVVGGGTSAIGFLLELENVASDLTWVSRRPIDFLEDGELNLEARASAVARQDEAARAGRALPSIVSGTGVPRTRRIQAGIERGVLTARPMFASIEPNGVRWEDGSFAEADIILWSTGFRPELRHLAPLKLREKAGGFVVANGTSWKDPRVFFAGYGPQASTIGANRAGRMIARQAIATLSRIKREQREEREASGEQAVYSFTPAAAPIVEESAAPFFGDTSVPPVEVPVERSEVVADEPVEAAAYPDDGLVRQPEVEPDIALEPEPDSEPDPDPDPDPEPEPEPEVERERAPDAEAEPAPELAPEPDHGDDDEEEDDDDDDLSWLLPSTVHLAPLDLDPRESPEPEPAPFVLDVEHEDDEGDGEFASLPPEADQPPAHTFDDLLKPRD